jgi:hypothetical protein
MFMTTIKEVVLDERRRTSLARVGRKDDDRYLVEELDDGTIILKPAVLMSRTEVNLLHNPSFKAAVAGISGPNPQVRRRPPPKPRST